LCIHSFEHARRLLSNCLFPEDDSISSFRFGSKPVIKPVSNSNLKLRIIIQVFGLSAPQRIYTTTQVYRVSLASPCLAEKKYERTLLARSFNLMY
jgi:hypothetical protein